MEDQRRDGAEHERQHDGQRGVVDRAPERADEPFIASQRGVVAQADERAGAGHLPVVHAHEQREQPRKHDHREDDRHGGNGK